jgi:hypothetical protein
MQKFSEWLQEKHPDFTEGLLQRIHSAATKTVKASSLGIGGLGVVGRAYAPFLASAIAASPLPASDTGFPIVPLTGRRNIDNIGSVIGHPDSQGWYDAGDFIPSDQQDSRSSLIKSAKLSNRTAVAAGFPDPNWRPQPVEDPTVPKKPRLTPQMKAKMRANLRRRRSS